MIDRVLSFCLDVHALETDRTPMIIAILAQAPDYSYHMPWYAKVRIGIIVASLLIAVGKAVTSGKSSSGSSTSPTSSFPTRTPVQQFGARPSASTLPPPPSPVPSVPPMLIFKDGRQLGPYNPRDVREHLSAGTFEPTDLAWHEGLSEWQPLGSIPGVNPARAPSRSPASSYPSSHSPTPNTVAPPEPSSTGVLIGGYICAVVSLLFLPPLLGLVGIICGVVVIKRQAVNQGVALLIVSFVCATLGMIIGAAS